MQHKDSIFPFGKSKIKSLTNNIIPQPKRPLTAIEANVHIQALAINRRINLSIPSRHLILVGIILQR